MSLYARCDVAFLWLVDPLAHILETYTLQDGRWTVTGAFKDQDKVIAEAFGALALALGDLWTEGEN